MSGDKITAIIGLVASVLDIPETALGAESSMETVAQWGSLAQLTICMAFQHRFGVKMDMQAIAHSSSIAKLAILAPRD